MSTTDLERLRAAAHRAQGELSEADLVAAGLPHVVAVWRAACVTSAPAWAAAVDAVLAERQRAKTLDVQLVWTGPDHAAGTTRDTAVAVRRLFEDAKRSVLVAGFSFHGASGILEPLHRAMERGAFRADLFVHVPRMEHTGSVEKHVAAFFKEFLVHNWPFGEPFPRLHYDPRTAMAGSWVSMHAKVVVVDDVTAFVGSANFTERAQDRNIEVGVLIQGGTVPMELAAQFRALVNAGHLKPAPPLEG